VLNWSAELRKLRLRLDALVLDELLVRVLEDCRHGIACRELFELLENACDILFDIRAAY
jgi:hypothetical protein